MDEAQKDYTNLNLNQFPVQNTQGKSSSNRSLTFISGVFGIGLFLFSFGFFGFKVLVPLYINLTGQSASAAPVQLPKTPYVPKYADVQTYTLIPKQVNEYTFNPEAIISEMKNNNPAATSSDITQFATGTIFKWLTLRKYFADNKITTLITLLPGTSNFRLSEIVNETTALANAYEAQYKKDPVNINGYYFKMRFSGISQVNKDKLGIQNTDELKKLAHDKLTTLMAGWKSPDDLLTHVNQDPQAVLLNNGEQSEHFTDYSSYPPIFDDPNFYSLLNESAAKPGTYSAIFTLKAKYLINQELEDYAYVVFYITDKTGTVLPIELLTDNFIRASTIK